MRKNLQHTMVMIVSVCLLSLIVAFMRQATFWLSYINTVSLVSLVLLMIGGSMWVLQSGVQDRVIRIFMLFSKHQDKVGQYVDQVAPQTMQSRPTLRYAVTYPFLWAGGLLFVGMYVVSSVMVGGLE
ncbi:DUF3899 domain-containing protein [Paenibacillus sp. N1-5-1-14]|uniref:DUF3899 domain-containing protein n=1 Tax=Paenibacillus radicibacter TaxID=2972488 RepID=UPI002158D48D|nr:DUF3899 domain-containing protein [Paenibacillus radicibacter]MCR8644783.1 DUF3899 domain-containing protein [Paenibacillus radicibacter]